MSIGNRFISDENLPKVLKLLYEGDQGMGKPILVLEKDKNGEKRLLVKYAKNLTLSERITGAYKLNKITKYLKEFSELNEDVLQELSLFLNRKIASHNSKFFSFRYDYIKVDNGTITLCKNPTIEGIKGSLKKVLDLCTDWKLLKIERIKHRDIAKKIGKEGHFRVFSGELFEDLRSELVSMYGKNKKQYPKRFETKIPEADIDKPGLLYVGSEEYSGIQSLEDYFESALKKGFGHKRFDVHDRNFQNLALRLLSEYPLSEMGLIKENNKKNFKAISMLVRARNYAIATREDVDWSGKIVSQESTKEKQAILRKNKESLILRDWELRLVDTIDKTPGSKKTKFSIVELSTRDAAIELAKAFPGQKVCWVNFANAHKSGGGYQIACTAQEEETATACDSIAVLGCVSEIADDGRATYKEGFHIPAGGNYFHRTHFFTDNEPIECYTIVQPFADFRNRDYAERRDFFSGSGDALDDIKDLDMYKARIKIDMQSVLRTAKAEGIDQVILGASGCGAFRHVPQVEVACWEEVVQKDEFRGHFTQISFAILGEDNLRVFQDGLKNLIEAVM